MPRPPVAKDTIPMHVVIRPPNYQVAVHTIAGDVPLVLNNFSEEAKRHMQENMELGSKSKQTKAKKEPRDFEAEYKGSMHVSTEGWYGIPCSAFRSALIRACSTCGVVMTQAKMCIFIEADGFEEVTGKPLVKITKGKPAKFIDYVRNSNGSPDLRARARWAPGWEIKLRVKYDADLYSLSTVTNLLTRAGVSVGICAGRPFSSNSAGQGWGTFTILRNPVQLVPSR